MSFFHYSIISVIAGVVTFLTTPFVRSFCIKRGFTARPGGRRIHETPIPEMGGTALFLGIVTACTVQLIGELAFGWSGFLSDKTIHPLMLVGVAAGTAVIYLTGLIDDIFDIAPGWKLAGQILSACIVAGCGVTIGFISNPFGEGIIQLGVLAMPLTIFYLVAFANIINLVDGLDGLAAGISAIAALSIAVIAAGQNQYAAALLSIMVVGSCIAFLKYNFNPASIFMGDEGSLTLGFLLGAVSLMGVIKTTATFAFAIPLLIVGVPLFDTLSAIIRRVLHSRPIKEADKGHIHHRLLGRGFSQRQTVLMVYAWSALLAVTGYLLKDAPGYLRGATLIFLLVLTGAIAYWLGLFEAAHYHDDDK